ncbi:UPF0262 family protein [Caulobacter sp. UNC279MFTsu5.1]|uniref:UPF0262 family protein n=1 Tax=Caulobacter sp. UNC279MFTsu5.1 TaxID=1502775 RepID=UPI0008EF9003|nr:UPF0262 family protein [Caulobacter sp. UNC279MFTsu5.1]SFJ97706.1 Uncharacterized protein, UPF0262 family [Caulobacter sp. UNC279MFTsu5.1]
MSDAKATQFLKSVLIDEDSLAAASRDQEQERQVAIFDLLDGNYFEPVESAGGPYDLKLSLVENRLALDITGAAPESGFEERRHLLSLSPFRGVIKDYFMICDSYYSAIRNSSPQQIEALDMGRRGLHNEGSNLLRERLEGKVKTDLDTARRLFTLICALHWRG